MAKKVKAAKVKKVSTLVSVVLDKSGSMSGNRLGTISGYSEYLNGLRSQKDADYNVSLIQFDAVGNVPEIITTYLDRPLADVKDLTATEYEPRGGAPLYDAIGECIRRTVPGERGVVLVIITDGHENASREFTRDSVKSLISNKKRDGWEFIFLGANIDSFAVGGGIGISASNVANYATGNEKMMFTSAAFASNQYTQSTRSIGRVAAASLSTDRFTKELRKGMVDKGSK